MKLFRPLVIFLGLIAVWQIRLQHNSSSYFL